MKHESRKKSACGSEESDPPFPLPPGASRGGAGSPHGANCAPPPARGISKRFAEIPLARSIPLPTRTCTLLKKDLSESRRHGKTVPCPERCPLAGFEVITDGRF
jgi:hypothetical protein